MIKIQLPPNWFEIFIRDQKKDCRADPRDNSQNMRAYIDTVSYRCKSDEWNNREN